MLTQETQQTKLNTDIGFVNYDDVLDAVRNEIRRAKEKHGPKNFNSTHEGFSVLKEEVDELWEDVKSDRKAEGVVEAIQVAAMAVRYAAELGTYPYTAPKPSHDEVTKDLLAKLFIHLNKK